jgi:hypothetical protein
VVEESCFLLGQYQGPPAPVGEAFEHVPTIQRPGG